MTFREFVEELNEKKLLINIKKPVSKKLEAAGLIHNAGPSPVLFSRIRESDFSVPVAIGSSKMLLGILADNAKPNFRAKM